MKPHIFLSNGRWVCWKPGNNIEPSVGTGSTPSAAYTAWVIARVV